MSSSSISENSYTQSTTELWPTIKNIDVTPIAIPKALFSESMTFKTQGKGLRTHSFTKPPSPFDSYSQNKIKEKFIKEMNDSKKAEIAAFAATLPPVPEKRHTRKKTKKIDIA